MGSAYLNAKRRLPEVGSLTPRPDELCGEAIDRDLLALYEQLLATRLELVQGTGPADGEFTLSRFEFDCVLAQLDSAIVTTRSMVSGVVPVPGAPPGKLDIHSAYGAVGDR
jgi:hypothetical protein